MTIIKSYASAADRLIPRYEAISVKAWLQPVLSRIPAGEIRVLDLGAGTGNIGAWFVARGSAVLAVEPVREFREAGEELHSSPDLIWLEDQLPELSQTLERNEQFDLVLLSGVWHHLTADERKVAMPGIRRLTEDGGRLILSLRHGPGVPGRPAYPVPPEETVALARSHGFQLIHRAAAPSLQEANKAAGVTWTWLVFEASPS